jgi:hypothetical protein
MVADEGCRMSGIPLLAGNERALRKFRNPRLPATVSRIRLRPVVLMAGAEHQLVSLPATFRYSDPSVDRAENGPQAPKHAYNRDRARGGAALQFVMVSME